MNATPLIMMVSPVHAQSVLEPPFGLHWGDSPEKLLQWASRLALDVTISMPGDQPSLRVVKIQPKSGNLPETEANGVEGRFLAGKLFELTVHYKDSGESADQVEARFQALRKHIAHEQGPLLADQQQNVAEDQFVTRKRSFHREPVKGIFLLLVISELKDIPRELTISKFSLIYRNENFQSEVLNLINGR
jgi:hypothetical protein